MPERVPQLPQRATPRCSSIYHGPERKVFTDPRLEVAGAELFARVHEARAGHAARINAGDGKAELDQIGRPVILVNHEYQRGPIGATVLRDAHWRCVWFDAIAAVFVHDSASRRSVSIASTSRPATSGRAAGDQSRALGGVAAWPGQCILRDGDPVASHRTGLAAAVARRVDACRGILLDVPDSALAWQMLGQAELARDPAPAYSPSPRFRLPFDPVVDLSPIRSTYALRRGLELQPDELRTLIRLDDAYARRGMHEAALGVLDRIAARVANSIGARGTGR